MRIGRHLFKTHSYFKIYKPNLRHAFHTFPKIYNQQTNRESLIDQFYKTSTRDFMNSIAPHLNRTPEELKPIIQTLEDNWYSTVGDLKELSPAEASSFKIPHRLAKIIQQKLAERVQILKQQELEASLESKASDFQAPTKRSIKKEFEELKISNRRKIEDYGLREDEISPSLRAEFEKFEKFMTQDFFGQQEPPIRKVSAEYYIVMIKLLLGWVLRHSRLKDSLKPEDLTFRTIFPDSSKQSAELVYDYLQWLLYERKCTPTYQGNALKAITKLAKFVFHDESKVDPNEGDKPYSDIALVKELRKYSKEAAKKRKLSAPASDESKKWMDWPEYLAVVEALRKECHNRTRPSGKPKKDIEIARDYVNYLIFSILSTIPDRQRTLRELELGRTLVKQNGKWYIVHGPDDYKTGKAYGQRPALQIADKIVPYLEEYIDKWRSAFKPNHTFLFSREDGKPYDRDGVYKRFVYVAFKMTGKKTNPHLIRDMIVTYLRSTDASEKSLEALALLMAHSIKMQRESYDHRTKTEKIAPAVELINSISIGNLPE